MGVRNENRLRSQREQSLNVSEEGVVIDVRDKSERDRV